MKVRAKESASIECVEDKIHWKRDSMLRLATVGHVTLDYISRSAWSKRALVPGGPAVHTSLAAASMGAEPYVVSKVGDDFGRRRTEWLEQTGVNTTFLKVTALPTTGFEIRYRKGRRALRLLSQCESLGFLDLRGIRAHSLHIGPVAHEISEDVAKSFADQSRLTSLDPQGYLRRVGRENRVLKRSWFDKSLLRRIDVLKVSSDELRTMTGNADPRDALRKLTEIGPRICILTKGGQGSNLAINEHVFRIPPTNRKRWPILLAQGTRSLAFSTQSMLTLEMQYGRLVSVPLPPP